MSEISTPVLVVGRGPVGMTVALRLAGFGIDSVIADPEGWDAYTGSKALCMQRESMEILEQVGCGRPMAEQGVSWTLGRTFYRNKEVSQVRFSPFSGLGFPSFVNHAQRDSETLLLDKLRDKSKVTKLLGHRLASITQDADGVDAVLQGPDGKVRCRANYVVGCDGSQSTVRKELGVVFSGKSYTTNFMIFDIRAELPYPDERRLHFDPPFNPGRTVLIHPLANSDWHIDWQVGPEPIDMEEEQRSGRADARIRSIVGDIPYEILWLTTYAFRSLIADRMRVGRVFIAGDAAHLVSPYGARGLNSGLADADNIAWKLACVLRDQASEALLESYQDERHPAAAENLRITDRTAQFMAPPSRLMQLKRKLVLALSARIPAARRFVNAGVFYEPAVYSASNIIGGDDSKSDSVTNLCGSVVPDATCTQVRTTIDGDDRTVRLRDFVGDEFVAFVVGPSSFSLAPSDHGALSDWPKDLPTCRVVIVARSWANDETGEPSPYVIHLADPDCAVATAFAPEGPGDVHWVYLVRPDSYIVAQWKFDDLTVLAERVAAAVGGADHATS